MAAGVLFWMIMILWLIFGIWRTWPDHYLVGGNILLWVLLALLGWHDFGPMLK